MSVKEFFNKPRTGTAGRSSPMVHVMGVAALLTLSLAAPFPSGWSASAQPRTTPPATPIAGVFLYGNGQHTAVNKNFASPIAVSLIGPDGQEVLGVAVHLTIASGSARIRLFDHGVVAADGQSATATSNSRESLVAVITAGSIPGPVSIVATAVADPAQSPVGDVTTVFDLRVDPPGWPPEGMPDTGGNSAAVIALAGGFLAVGVALLALARHRPSRRT